MRFSRRVAGKIFRFIKSEIKSWITFEYNRCDALSREGKRCIKQGEHILWHEDAWSAWWWGDM